MIGQRCGKVFTANVLGAPSRAPSYAVKRVTRWGLKERKKQALLTEVRRDQNKGGEGWEEKGDTCLRADS